MIPYSGDYKEDSSVYIMFNTFSSDDPSASCTITNFANTDVHIHKDDGLAQRNNAAGITVSVDFDGITGSHMIKIDTSDDTVAGFWVTGKDYFVRIEGTTIDGGTINAVVGRFSIENRFSEVDVVKWLGQACAAVTVNGVPEVDITHLLGTAWLAPGVAGTPDVNAKQLGGTAQTGRDVGADVLLSSGSGAGQLDFTSGVVKSNLAQILGTALTETAGWLAAGFKKLFNVAAPLLVASDVMRGTDSAALATGVELNAQGKLDVNAECDTALTDYDSPTKVEQDSAFTEIKGGTWAAGTDTLEHIRNKETDIETGTQDIQSRIPAALVTGRMSSDAVAISGSTDAADKLEASAETIVVGAAATGTLSTTEMTTDLTISVNDQMNGRILIFKEDTTTAALRRQATDITDSVTTNGKLTFTALTTAPVNGDTFIIV
ncbi:hypothetical protein KA005_00530 [bacterium]|nr:hypothetical protein [bacterium]